MQGQRASRESGLVALATEQHGVVSYWQLLDLGFSSGAIEHRVRTGRLHRIHRGVYAVGHRALTAEGRDIAAVLACGPGAVLSHWSAASRWGLLYPRPGPVTVTVRSHRRRQAGIWMHHVEDLHPEDETRRDRIPITSVPRTLLDLAAVADTPKLLTRAVNEADRQGRLNRRAVRELIDRNSGNRGVRRLRTVIAAVSPGTGRSRSDLETLFLAVCRKYGLPQPNVNTMIEGFEVDIHFPGTRLIVELDSWKYHGTPHSFDRDRRRDAELKRRGYEVLRVSDKWLNADPRGVAETVRALIERPVQRT